MFQAAGKKVERHLLSQGRSHWICKHCPSKTTVRSCLISKL